MLTNFISLLHCIIARFIRKVWIVNAGNNIKLARIYLKMIEFDEEFVVGLCGGQCVIVEMAT